MDHADFSGAVLRFVAEEDFSKRDAGRHAHRRSVPLTVFTLVLALVATRSFHKRLE